MKTSIFLPLIFSVLLFSCDKEDPKDHLSSDVTLNKSSSDFLNAMENRSPQNSDPFELKNIVIENNQVKITVSYSGGCKAHSFSVLWNGAINNSIPPAIQLVIIHNANGDNCEAYITETIVFQIDELIENLGDVPESVGAHNGWNPDESVEYEGSENEFSFIEGDECTVIVTAREVICGNGLYDNLWFALEDSTSAGSPGYYFYNYLQPVIITSALSEFTPVKGKKYRIGARRSSENPFSDQPVCLAYSGPSIPVKIMCITEIN